MLADLTRVVFCAFFACRFVDGFVGVEIGLEGDLGIDYDMLATGQVHDEIRPQSATLAVAAGDGNLLAEIAVLEHAGHFDNTLELHFAPAAPHARRTQRRDEVAGLIVKPVMGFADGFELGDERTVVAVPLLLDLRELGVDLGERFGDGLHHGVDGLFAGLQGAGGFFVLLAQRTLSEFEEELVVVL